MLSTLKISISAEETNNQAVILKQCLLNKGQGQLVKLERVFTGVQYKNLETLLFSRIKIAEKINLEVKHKMDLKELSKAKSLEEVRKLQSYEIEFQDPQETDKVDLVFKLLATAIPVPNTSNTNKDKGKLRANKKLLKTPLTRISQAILNYFRSEKAVTNHNWITSNSLLKANRLCMAIEMQTEIPLQKDVSQAPEMRNTTIDTRSLSSTRGRSTTRSKALPLMKIWDLAFLQLEVDSLELPIREGKIVLTQI